MRRCSLIILGTIALGLSPLARAAEINTGTLLAEMVDLPRLAAFPLPEYQTVQFSSYDRRSQIPGGPGWFANSDGFGREPIPTVQRTLQAAGPDGVGRYVFAEVEGPGAIVRLQTALIYGKIELYLDHARQPVFAGAAEDFLWRLYPTLARAHGEPADGYADSYTQRNGSYYPVPFAKACRVVWIGNLERAHFYQIQIRKYAKGAKVRTFQPSDLATYREEIARVGEILRQPSRLPQPAGAVHPIAVAVAPGETTTALELSGSGAIAELTLQLRAPDLDRALRATVLRISCDGYTVPQVESPLGDFFGSAPGINPYDCIPMRVAPDGTMTCRFLMPYAKSARILLENHGAVAVNVGGRAIVADYSWNDRSMYLFARWRVNHGLSTAHGVFDLPFVLAHGRGVYVGTVVYLMNPTLIPTVGGAWWGEGDEKIFVDNDAFPSTFGTGSEDYFNYAWGSPNVFQFGYIGQSRNDGPGTRGWIVNNRWHILDDIPFQQNLAFFMELFHHHPTEGFSYARMSYYYARPGAFDDHVRLQDADVTLPTPPRNWQPLAAGDARGGIFYQFEDLPGAEGHVVANDAWSNGRGLVWTPSSASPQLELKFKVEKAGQYSFHLALGVAPYAGRVSLLVDGRPIVMDNAPWQADLYIPYHTAWREFVPGIPAAIPPGVHPPAAQFINYPEGAPVQLSAGEHTLSLVSQGKNDRSAGAVVLGDFFWLLPK